jgi:hypothetical protein
MPSDDFSITGYRISAMRTVIIGLIVFAVGVASPVAQGDDRGALDQILDLYVRDGYVYYRALKSDRRRLDGFVAGLAAAPPAAASREEQMAYWLNAYNALVLRMVVDHYPMPRRSNDYPPGSIRQIPGAFERLTHRVAGRSMTLDQIEQTILPEFADPRMYFALGRGAVGGGRLRSEAYTAGALDRQLSEVARECVSRNQCVQVDRGENVIRISSIFSWRERPFADVYGPKGDGVLTTRSPVERAALAFVLPNLTASEREFIERNTFKVEFSPFDWALNDLTGRGGR